MNELFNFLKPLSDRTTPRWIILVIDMLIVVLSCALVSASDTFNVATISRFDILRNYCVVVGVFLFVSFFSKSYAYIIRLTALNDLFRTLTLCIVSLIVLIVINVIVQQVTGSPWFGMWGIAMVVFTAFCLMTAERLSIKYLYFKLMHFGSGRRAGSGQAYHRLRRPGGNEAGRLHGGLQAPALPWASLYQASSHAGAAKIQLGRMSVPQGRPDKLPCGNPS